MRIEYLTLNVIYGKLSSYYESIIPNKIINTLKILKSKQAPELTMYIDCSGAQDDAEMLNPNTTIIFNWSMN